MSWATRKLLCSIAAALVAAVAVPAAAGQVPDRRAAAVSAAASCAEAVDVIILTPNHSRSIYYELSGPLVSDSPALHATFVFTLGAGTLTIGVANASFIGDNAELVFVTAGFINTTPVLDYSYSSGVLTATIPVPDVSFGILLTGVLFGVNNPEYPVTMSMSFSL